MLATLATLACLLHSGLGQSTLITAPAPSITVQTAVPSPSAALGDPLPSQASLPPKQSWCPSEIFCAGPVRIPGRLKYLSLPDIISYSFCKQ